jgi:hypothetical protein
LGGFGPLVDLVERQNKTIERMETEILKLKKRSDAPAGATSKGLVLSEKSLKKLTETIAAAMTTGAIISEQTIERLANLLQQRFASIYKKNQDGLRGQETEAGNSLKDIIGQFENSIKSRHDRWEKAHAACQVFLGTDLGSADFLAELIVEEATPLVLDALESDSCLQEMPKVAKLVGNDLVRSVLTDFANNAESVVDAIAYSRGMQTKDLDSPELAHIKTEIELMTPGIQTKAKECLMPLNAAEPTAKPREGA